MTCTSLRERSLAPDDAGYAEYLSHAIIRGDDEDCLRN